MAAKSPRADMGTSTINGRGCNPLKESSRISAINIAITLTGATAFDAHAQHRLPQAKTLAAVSHGAHVRRVKAGSLIANYPMIGDVTGRCAIWNPTLTCSNVIPRRGDRLYRPRQIHRVVWELFHSAPTLGNCAQEHASVSCVPVSHCNTNQSNRSSTLVTLTAVFVNRLYKHPN